eukprot:363958-Chlamydomonas_euryale.AAC.8
MPSHLQWQAGSRHYQVGTLNAPTPPPPPTPHAWRRCVMTQHKSARCGVLGSLGAAFFGAALDGLSDGVATALACSTGDLAGFAGGLAASGAAFAGDSLLVSAGGVATSARVCLRVAFAGVPSPWSAASPASALRFGLVPSKSKQTRTHESDSGGGVLCRRTRESGAGVGGCADA